MLRRLNTLILVFVFGIISVAFIRPAAAAVASDCGTLNASGAGPGDSTNVILATSVSLAQGDKVVLSASTENILTGLYLSLDGGLVAQSSAIGWGGYGISYTLPSDGVYTISAASMSMVTRFNPPVNYTVYCIPAPTTTPNPTPDPDATPKPRPACPIFHDGRLNNCDAGQTVAVYCKADGLAFYAIDDGKGSKLFTLSYDEINAVPKNPDVNTLIADKDGVLLYRLTSGKLQVMRPESRTGKYYKYIFNDCL